jgi:hypothetical protein
LQGPALAARPADPESLAVILKHPLCHTGLDRGEHLKRTRDLELQLSEGVVVEQVILQRRGMKGLEMAFFTVNGVVSCVLGTLGVVYLFVDWV